MQKFQFGAARKKSDAAVSPAAIAPQAAVSDDPSLLLSISPAPDAPFQTSVAVTLFCAVPGAEIRYAQDGDDVDENSALFDAKIGISLTQNTEITARAFQNGARGPLLRASFEVRRALWQENEPTDLTDGVPHKTSENLAAPDGWNMAAGSVRGKLHAHRGLWREDSLVLGTIETSNGVWCVQIVSDGAGSAPLSRVGSKIACEGALRTLRASLSQIATLETRENASGESPSNENAPSEGDFPQVRAALVEAAHAALNAMRREADSRNQPVSAFAATLLILLRREWNGAQLCAALQVGDGAIALHCESGLKLLGVADHGQHSSETRFLTTAGIETEFAARIQFSCAPDLRATLVVSDGVSDDFFPENVRVREVFEAVLPLVHSAPDAGASVLSWLGYEKKGSSDDRTLVLSWPVSPVSNSPVLEPHHGD